MGKLENPLQFTRFVFKLDSEQKSKAGKGKVAEAAAAGLFALYCSAPNGETEPADPALVRLGFVDGHGVMHDAESVENPWFLYRFTSRREDAGLKEGAPALNFAPVPSLFCLIAHPSPTFAKDLLKRARDKQPMNDAGKAFVWTSIAPTAVRKNTLVFELPHSATAFVPGGTSTAHGWLLYYRMPYEVLPDVKAEVTNLALALAELRYPVPSSSGNSPYDKLDSVFSVAVQAALHKFQSDAAAGTAFKYDASKASTLKPWGYLHGSALDIPKAAIPERGVVDKSTWDALQAWKLKGCIRPGDIAVPRGELWARAEYWWRFKALELFCSALGSMYVPKPGTSFRFLGSSGGGQADQSKHKIGIASDLDSVLGEPSNTYPFGYEADWEKVKNDAYDARWLVFMHSTVPMNAALDTAQVRTVPEKLREYIDETWGPDTNNPIAEAVFEDTVKLADNLIRNGASTEPLAPPKAIDEYFREKIRRFQYRTEADGGNVMREISAREDAQNQKELSAKTGICSWLNLTRLAHDLKLYRISARDDFRTVGYTKDSERLALSLGENKLRSQKAFRMDCIADSVASRPEQFVNVADAKGEIARIPGNDFDVKVLRDWMTRPSDDPKVLPEALLGFTYTDKGIDLIMDVLWNGEAAQIQREFLKTRDSLRVKLMEVGEGFDKFDLDVGTVLRVSELRVAIEGSGPLPQASAHPYRIVVRPLLVKTEGVIDHLDPGTLTHTVDKLAEVKSLEWWHFELDWEKGNWVAQAEAFGYHPEALTIPVFTTSTTTTAPWQGGAGMTGKPSSYSRPSRPNNVPAIPELPILV